MKTAEQLRKELDAALEAEKVADEALPKLKAEYEAIKERMHEARRALHDIADRAKQVCVHDTVYQGGDTWACKKCPQGRGYAVTHYRDW